MSQSGFWTTHLWLALRRGFVFAALLLAAIGSGPWMPSSQAEQATPTPSSGAMADVFPPNFVRFGGVFFVGGGGPGPRGPLALGRELEEADLGPEVGRVTAQVQDGRTLGACPLAGLPEGSASFLPIDTPLYAVAGYATWFRLATRSNGHIWLYEAVCGERARVGADLLDIAGQVARVSVRDAAAVEVAAFEDPTDIERLVGLVLVAPIDTALLEPDARQLGREFYLVFLLEDGTSTAREIRPYQGELLLVPGVVLPPEFGALVAEAAGGTFWETPSASASEVLFAG
jgi:hypothetical protein